MDTNKQRDARVVMSLKSELDDYKAVLEKVVAEGVDFNEIFHLATDVLEKHAPNCKPKSCSSCKTEKPDVSWRRDPFALEVNNEEKYDYWCGDCLTQRAEDI
jgi:hypothetical protein